MAKFKNKLYQVYFGQSIIKAFLNFIYYGLIGLSFSLMIGFFALNLSDNLGNKETLLISNSLIMFGFMILLIFFIFFMIALFKFALNGFMWSKQLLLVISIIIYLKSADSFLADIMTLPYDDAYSKFIYNYLLYLISFLIIKFGKTYITNWFDNYNKKLVLVDDYKIIIKDFFNKPSVDLVELENQIIKDDYKNDLTISKVGLHRTVTKLPDKIEFSKDVTSDNLSEDKLFALNINLKRLCSLPFITTFYI